MIANGVKETSTTTGTGNITLAGAESSSFETFNDALGLNVRFPYWIRNGDGAGSEWETGIGYLSGTTTLVRDDPQEGSATTPVSFTGGDLVVFIAQSISTEREHPVAMGADLGANIPWFQSALVNGGGNTSSQNADTIYYTQMDLDVGGEWASMAQQVVAAGSAGEEAIIGLYDVGNDGLPDNLLTDNNLIIDISSTGSKNPTFAASMFINAGTYYVAFVSESGSATFRGTSRSNMSKSGLLGIQPGNGRALSSCSESYTAGWTTPVLPANATAAAVQGFELVPIGYLVK